MAKSELIKGPSHSQCLSSTPPEWGESAECRLGARNLVPSAFGRRSAILKIVEEKALRTR